METIEKVEKINVKKFKDDIKNLSEEQKFLKNQRKTKKLVGERVMEPWRAAYKHQSNREKLRLMFAAYGLVRGNSFSQTENKFTEENHPLNQFKNKIEDFISQYTIKEESLI